jgi:type IV secretory system conjugative DNA transfer VirD4/TraG family protein
VCFEHSRNLERAEEHRAEAFKAHFAGRRPTQAQAIDFLRAYDADNPPLKGYPDLRDVRWWLSEGIGSGGKGVETSSEGITKLCRRVRHRPHIRDDAREGVPEAIRILAGDFAGSVTDGLRDALQTARDDLAFLIGSEAMMSSLTGPGFDFRQLRKKLTTVYLILPAREMASYSRWLRLVVAVAFRQLQGEVSERTSPVLFLLDEFLQMGRMDTLLTSYDQAASLGVQLWPIVQQFPRFKKLYGEEWQNFVSGAGAVCGLTPADTFTAKQLAELCGRTTVAVPGRGGNHVQGSGLALYDDLLRMAPGELLVFLRGHEPPLPGVPNPFKSYAPPYFEPGSRFSDGLEPRPIAVG